MVCKNSLTLIMHRLFINEEEKFMSKRIPIGLGLFSVRRALESDLEGTLKKVRAIGFEAVEFYGKIYPDSPRLAAALKDTDLKVVGWHTPIDLFEDDRIENTIAFHKTIGNPNLVVPGLPHEMTADASGWHKSAELMGKIARKIKTAGLTFGYHNHSVEFKPLDNGEYAWDIIAAVPDLMLQIDNGNALAGGGDTVALLKKYPGRAKTIHLKPFSLTDGNSTMIGKDDIPWLETFAELERQGGTEWALVEYEDEIYEEFEGVRLCFEALKAMGKA